MSEFKKLFQAKRILALVLALAMAVTMLPTTAYAAPVTDSVSSEGDEADDTFVQDDDDDKSDPGLNVTPTEDAQDEDTSDMQEPEDDIPTAGANDGEGTTPDTSEDGNNTEGTEPANEAAAPAPQADDDAETGAQTVEYRFGVNDDIVTTAEYSKDATRFAVETEASEGVPAGMTVNNDILTSIYLQDKKNPEIYLSDTENDLVKTVTYSWNKVDENGTATPLGAGKAPKDAGKYQLVITLPAKANEYEKAETTIDFEVTKANVMVYFSVPTVKPGTEAKDVAIDVEYVEATDGTLFTYGKDIPETAEVDESANNEVDFSDLTVKEAIANKPLEDADKLVKGVDYVVVIAPKFIGTKAETYEKNYEFRKISEMEITVADLKSTNVVITLDPKYDTAEGTEKDVESTKNDQTVNKIAVVYEYDKEVSKPVYTAKVVDPEGGVDEKGNSIPVDIEAAKVSDGEWHAAAYESWEETATDAEGKSVTKQVCNLTVGGELDSAPVDAGTYVYRVNYEGDGEEYASSYADIVVVVEQAELIIKPSLSVESFNEGQKVADVLAKVTPEVVKADGSKFEIPATEKDSFWGTSYVDNQRTQPYEPVFEVVETLKVTTTDKDGKPVGDPYTESWVLNKNDALSSNTTETDEEGNTTAYTYEYIVRFSGEKAVYYASGAVYRRKGINDTDVNSANYNYVVKVDDDTRNSDDNTAKFDVNESKLTTINTEDVTKALLEKDGVRADERFYDAVTKVYDGNAFYTNRADYKKAKLMSGDTEVTGVKSTDLIYRWYKLDGDYDNAVDAMNDKDENGNFIEPIYSEGDFYEMTSLISPVIAGIYKLEISYEDKTGEYAPAEAEVYFVIEKQKVYVKLNKEINYEEFSGITVDEFLSDHWGEIDYSIETELDSPSQLNYIVDWVNFQVEEKQKNDDGTDKKDADGNVIYKSMQGYERFLIDPALEKDNGDNYRLAVGNIVLWDWNWNYTIGSTTIEKVTTKVTDPETGNEVDKTVEQKKVIANLSHTDDNTAKITVKKMGDTAITVDTGSDEPFVKDRVYDGESVYKDFEELLNKIKVVKAEANADGTKEAVTDAPLTYNLTYDYSEFLSERELKEYDWGFFYSGDISAEELKEVLDSLIDGGTYTISVSFRGDAKYQPIPVTTIATLEVTQKEIILTPPTLENAFAAGDKASTVTDEARKAFEANAAVEGYLDMDAPFFKVSSFYPYTIPAWTAYYYSENDYGVSYPTFRVYDKMEQRLLANNEVLKGEGSDRYTLHLFDEGTLHGVWAADYQITAGQETPITTVRGNATVRGIGYSPIASVTAFDNIEGMNHSVALMSGINYITYDGKEGNFVAVEILAPAEYVYGDTDPSDIWDKAVFEASIQKAGGTIVRGAHRVTDTAGRYRAAITVVFDAQDKEDVTFGIHWDDDYIENFTILFSEANCLGNLEDAVAPKTLAFNSPNKKMAVGEIQELDVKMTKVQNNDVILLGYEVSNPEVLSISEYGKVTALSKGSANVTVYAMHLVNGVKEPIKDAKGKYAKSASVKITVTDVTAPKISKVTPLDNSATVQYSLVDNGYRREVYVLEGKNLKEKVFTDKIDAMANEQWEGIFAFAPRFITSDSKVYDSKKHAYINAASTTISGLKANTAYTVYIRNVSGVRTLSDGSQVVLSAAGSVKSFTTTKQQVKYLSSELKDKYLDYYYDDEDDDGVYYYNVKLSEGKVTLNTYAYFEDLSEAADPSDRTDGILLPLKGADKKTYVAPKLAYYIWAEADRDGYYDAYTGRFVHKDEWYLTTSSERVSINNKGIITLKQPGWVQILVVDTNTGIGYTSNQLNLYITADADSIKAKTTTLQVGQEIRLENLVDYKEGNKVLSQNNYYTYGRIDGTELKEQIEAGGFFELIYDEEENEYKVRALKKGGKIQVTLTDREIEAPKNTAKITLKSVDLAAVKNMKLVDVIDNSLNVEFEANPNADAYRIEVRDSRKTLVRSVYLKDSNCSYKYNAKTHEWDIVVYKITGLTQQSKYTVSVTALYKDTPSKAVTKNVTTTKLPASDGGWNKGEYGPDDEYLGIDVTVWDSDRETDITAKSFVSGNTYTITAQPDNRAAQYAITDTLTWVSTNTKVATVKANAGTYSATLKAVKNGSTYIEVWSKITKKLIARYKINVATVGDAYNNQYFYGDNEDLRGDGSEPSPIYTELTLGVPVAVELDEGQSQSFRFTAPENGNYCLYRVYTNGSKTPVTGYGSIRLSEGEDFAPYKAEGSASYSLVVEKLKGTDINERTPLKIGETRMQVQYGQWFVFTAPEEGIYSFDGMNFNLFETSDLGTSVASSFYDDGVDKYNLYYQLDANETVYLRSNNSGSYTVKVEKLNVASLTADAEAPTSVGTDKYSWFKFTATKDAKYEFKLTADSYWNMMYIYNMTGKSLKNSGSTGYGRDLSISRVLGVGGTVYIRVYNEDSVNTLKLAVTTDEGGIDEITTEEALTDVEISSESSYYVFNVPEDGIYEFRSEGGFYNSTYAELVETISGESIVPQDSNYYGKVSVEHYLKKDSTIYLKLWSDYDKTVTIRVEQKELMDIGEDGSSISIDPHSTKWFEYKAAAAESYTFTVKGNSNAEVYLYSDFQASEALAEDKGSNAEINYNLVADQIVYLKVKNIGDYSAINVTVNAKSNAPVPVTEDETAEVKIDANSEQWFTFTADDAADYAFIFNSDNSDCTVYWSDTMGESYSDTTTVREDTDTAVVRSLDIKETIYCRVYSSYYNTTFTVNVKKLGTLELTTDNEAGATTKLYPNSTSEDLGKQLFSFKAEKAGRYNFTFSGTISYSASLYEDDESNEIKDAENITVTADTDVSYDYYLDENVTVYWKLENTGNSSGTVTVKVEEISVTSWTEVKDEEAIQVPANSSSWFSYTLASEGSEETTYIISFEDLGVNTDVSFYSDLQTKMEVDLTDGTDENGNTIKCAEIPVSEVVYWKIKNAGSTEINVKMSVKEKTEESPDEDEES